MGSLYPHIFFFLSFLMSVILFGMTVFAFSAPKPFASWFTPWHWISRQIWKSKAARFDQTFAWTCGSLCFGFLLILCFMMGGFFITGIAQLWKSPFSILFGIDP